MLHLLILTIAVIVLDVIRKYVTSKKYKTRDIKYTVIYIALAFLGNFVVTSCNSNIDSFWVKTVGVFVIFLMCVIISLLESPTDTTNKSIVKATNQVLFKSIIFWALPLGVGIWTCHNTYEKIEEKYLASKPVTVENVRSTVKNGNELLLLTLSNKEDIVISVYNFPFDILKTEKGDTIKYYVYDDNVVKFKNLSKSK